MKQEIKLTPAEEWDFTEHIESLLSRNESVDLEFKTAKEGVPHSIWETYSSFANTDGGVIILGVREKRQELFVEGLSRDQIVAYTQTIWNQLNNPDCVNINLLTDKNVFSTIYKGKHLLLIDVPRAMRSQRPIYLTKNPIGHTYKRNNEGDYKCTSNEIRRMMADADEVHSRDSRILHNYSMEDIDPESFKQYRQLLSNRQPDHPWLGLSDIELLKRLGGYRKDRQNRQEGFTLAGILMFGKTESITDNECAPNYFPDYQEHFQNDSDIRWTDRICPDGTWEANLFQFYRRVFPKLSAVLPKPFQMENGVRLEDTSTHVALREAFINTLVHCDYAEEGKITIEQWKDHYTFKNPGTLLVSKIQYYTGGESVCRNKSLQKMFMMIGFSEKAGSGVNKILSGWKKANWKPPFVEEQNHPDKIKLYLPMVSLLPDDVKKGLKERFGERVEQLENDWLTTLSVCYTEQQVSNDRLQSLISKHSVDITRMLKKMGDEGYLTSCGNGRGKKYFINKEQKVDTLNEQKVDTYGQKVDTYPQKVDTSIQKVESKYMRYETLSNLIKSIANEFVSIDEIAFNTEKKVYYLQNKIIPRMVEEKKLERLYPDTPNHPQQKYRST